jgi:hypothetical protein
VIAELALTAALLVPPPSPFVPNDGWIALPQGQAATVGFFTACDHGVRLWMVHAPTPGYAGITSQPDPTCLNPGVPR